MASNSIKTEAENFVDNQTSSNSDLSIGVRSNTNSSANSTIICGHVIPSTSLTTSIVDGASMFSPYTKPMVLPPLRINIPSERETAVASSPFPSPTGTIRYSNVPRSIFWAREGPLGSGTYQNVVRFGKRGNFFGSNFDCWQNSEPSGCGHLPKCYLSPHCHKNIS